MLGTAIYDTEQEAGAAEGRAAVSSKFWFIRSVGVCALQLLECDFYVPS